MSHPIPDAETTVPSPELYSRVADSPVPTLGRLSSATLRSTLQTLGSVLILPLLVIAAVVSFVFVLADFALFRLQYARNGRPAPKRLWEF